ncbi:MAG: ABC transporter permease, partial [Peptococcaceae bacterium]|nr:ABC transporter permease [Peptococcaceae bacterium]
LPSIAPYILAGASTAMGLGLKVVVAAEALSQPKLAIGTRMQVERMYLETAGLFAWTITALFLSWLLEYGIRWVEKRVRGSG